MKRSSRKLLCAMLSAVITIGSILLISTILINATICSHAYVSKFVETSEIKEYCHNTYNERIALLAENSNIPIRVFEIAQEIDGYSESALDKFFNGSDTTIYTNDRIDTYEAMIKEYLDGNNQSYDETAVHNTAVKAAEIYSDCFGLKDIASLQLFVNNAKACYGRLTSFGLMLIFVPMLIIFMLFTTKKKALDYYFMSASATGLTMIFAAFICLIAGVGKNISITPEIYQSAIFSAINFMLAVVILLGAVITATAIVFAHRVAVKRAKKDS